MSDFIGGNGTILITVEPPNKETSGPAVLSFIERLEVIFYRLLISACPLLGGLSSFRVSFIGGFTVYRDSGA